MASKQSGGKPETGDILNAGAAQRMETPIDFTHLARQTMDDADLQREVLAIFIQQAQIARLELPAAMAEQRRPLAHKLKGAAQAVGAFAVADCAARLMEQPDDVEALRRIDGLLDATIGYVADFLAR